MSEARDNRDRISRRAHEIWEREGQPYGRHDDHWAQAQAEIEAEDAARPITATDAPAAPRKSTTKGTRAAAETLSTVENGAKAGKTAKPSVTKPKAPRKDGGKGASPR